jgi:hypothetical protein
LTQRITFDEQPKSNSFGKISQIRCSALCKN